jgi:hypothetical protein
MQNELYHVAFHKVCQYTTFDQTTGQKTKMIAPEECKTLIDACGCGVITRMWATLPGWFWRHWDKHARIDPLLLRSTILTIYFDDAQSPSVLAPIGDFFGIGHMEYRHYLSRYLGMSSGGFYSYFPMPFEKRFRLDIQNIHPTEGVEIFLNLNCSLYDKLPDGAGRFHCAFNCGVNPGYEPLEVADIHGEGHLTGCALSLQGSELNYLSFLEAPEYIWIDNAEAPAIVGTGMEDFFNGGWYFRNGEFAGALHGVPLKDSLRSMVSMYRFLDEDRIPFQQHLRMSFINPFRADRLKPFHHSSTVYYYLLNASEACYELPEFKRLSDVYRVRDCDFLSIP